MAFNGTITITFTDGLASLKIDDGAARIPLGVLDRWMRTKGLKLFKAQQMALDKRRTANRAATGTPSPNQPPAPKAPAPKAPPAPASEASKPEGQPKTGLGNGKVVSPAIAAAIAKRQNGTATPGDAKPNEQEVIDKLNKGYVDGKKRPELAHPEMDKIEAAIARTQGETDKDSIPVEATAGTEESTVIGGGDNSEGPATEEKVNESAE